MSPILGIYASSMQPALNATNYFSIATVTVGAGGSSSVTFSSIPSTYTHLQIRGFSKSNRSGVGQENIYYSFNSDTGANYTQHGVQGNGATTSAYGGSNNSGNNVIWSYTCNNDANIFGVQITDILDYANTNKYKVIRSLSGYDTNNATSGYVLLSSSLWQNTTAISTINLTPAGGTFLQYSTFALYGIKA